MKLALFGGTFNPIHYGHLILAEQSRITFNLDKIIFIPAGKPPHKPNKSDESLASGQHRFNLVKLAIENNPYFAMSNYELKKYGPSYTYQTIEYYKSHYPKDILFFIIGSDLLLQIDTWKKGKEILNMCKFLVGYRPIFSLKNIPEKIKNKVEFFSIPYVDISSTSIRNCIRKNISIRYLTTEKVEKYILKNKLYK